MDDTLTVARDSSDRNHNDPDNNGTWLDVTALDLNAHGIATLPDGKVAFIEGALPGERVRVEPLRRKARWESARAVRWSRQSNERVTPRCPHFGVCGGCAMQHLGHEAQLAVKQRALEDALWHVGRVRAERIERPLRGTDWGYRGRGRLSARYVMKKAAMLVGFHERKSSYVADMRECPILPAALDALLVPLRECLAGMHTRDQLPQIEFAADETGITLVLRHLAPLPAEDRERLRQFAQQHGVRWWLQPKGPDSAAPLEADDHATPCYSLPEFGLRMPYRPTDFTQVNLGINRALVSLALRKLDLEPQHRVVDWFCGMGNFTLPLATRVGAGQVTGVEGSAALLQRAAHNAQQHNLQVRFVPHNLFELSAATLSELVPSPAERWLLDPPREGALALLMALHALRETSPDYAPPARLVYVSCNPATLARDLGFAVHQLGYRLLETRAVNMFPHTAHVESLSVLAWAGQEATAPR